MYKKTDVMNELVLLMQDADEGVSLKDIMSKYEVSLRTATRMKDAIVKKYPQVIEIAGKYNSKKWKLPKDHMNKLISFTADEIHALESAAKLMNEKKIINGTYLDSVLCKVKSLMGSDAISRIEPDAEALLEAEGYALRPGPKIKTNKEFMEKIRNALIACKVIKIKYQSKTKNEWRTIEPYGFLYGNKHYLIAWHTKRKAMCHFDLNNIQDIEVLNEYFVRDTEFRLDDFSSQSFGVYQEEPFDVEWLFDKEVAQEAAKYTFHPTQTTQMNEDGTLTVKFHAGGAREMDWHLYTWGNHVKVIEPKDFDERKIWRD